MYHIRVEYTDLKEKFPELAFSPYVASPVIVRRGSSMEGGYLFGVDLEAEAKANDATIMPVDSEHSAVFQALVGEDISAVEAGFEIC